MNIVNKRFWFFLVAAIIVVIGIASLSVFGLKSGIEFSAGSLITVDFENQVEQGELVQELTNLGYGSTLIQRTGQGDFILRMQEITGAAKTQLETALTSRFGKLHVKEFDAVSAMVASEMTRNAGIAVLVAAVAMLLYITYAFRRMPSPFRFGVCAIAGLIYDVFVAIGVFSILGGIMNWEINLMFITGVLAVIGYSINNIVIVFDRIRENKSRGVSLSFEVIVNNSVVETLSRSFNTSLTTLFALFALALFVGASIQNFVIVLIVGVISGVFTSTCIAPTLLVVWEKHEWGRFLSWLPAGSKARGG